MLRILVAALMLITALPNAAYLCNAWCATHQTAERCQHAGAARAATFTAAHDCSDGFAGTPSLNERTKTSAPDVRALLTSAIATPPPAAWVALTNPGRPTDLFAHTPLKTILRI